MEEPSVLDYIKSRLPTWKGAPIQIPPARPEDQLPEGYPPQNINQPAAEAAAQAGEGAEAAIPSLLGIQGEAQREPASVFAGGAAAWPIPQTKAAVNASALALPWRSLLALALALAGQSALEPPGRDARVGILFYALAAGWAVYACLRGEWRLALRQDEAEETLVQAESHPVILHPSAFLLSLPLALVAFLTFGGNLFTPFNLALWLTALALLVYSIWLPGSFSHWAARLRSMIQTQHWTVHITPWALLLLATLALSVFFRAYRLSQVPPEMVSDHAEKLLDVSDVLSGQTHIFFPRNTGREAFQMYLTAAVSLVFGTGLSFMSLKIGTVTCGLLTLPFIYLIGKEMGNREAGLWAMAFAGIAYWPNLISRIALRFTLYPFFYAPALYFLVRALRRRSRNDFILSGIFVGLGLHGYSPFRVVPIVIAVAVGLYLLHRQSNGFRRQAGLGLLVIALVSLYIFLPLMRYALDNPEMFSYRAITRLSSAEHPLPGPPVQIFMQNLWNALTMFAWDNGEVWVISVTHRPVLDLVSGALFHLGVVLTSLRYLRRRHWFDLFTLVSIPILMLPSILSLAFPSENPSLNRTAAALVPVFLVIGMALEGLLAGLKSRLSQPVGPALAWGLGLFLLVWASAQNYDLVFNQYEAVYEMSSWNTTEMGKIVHDFAGSIGSIDTAWLVAYPYWADSRLVGINAGYPTRDIAISPDHLNDTLADPRAKLFLLNIQDTADVDTLHRIYPQGVVQEYPSRVESKNFLVFYVPPTP